jgi:DNA invertase Pin-like site-specific DNA recombinase
MGTIIGYARVSTEDQNLSLQRDALRAAGCERIFEDSASGSKRDRPGLDEALRSVGTGDVLIVWKLDRLGRSLRHLLEIVEQLRERGVIFRSLTEAIDTSTATGKLVHNILASVAEFERDLNRERTTAGMESARRRGVHLGRRPALTGAQLELARLALSAPGATISHVARQMRVGRATLYRALAAEPAS